MHLKSRLVVISALIATIIVSPGNAQDVHRHDVRQPIDLLFAEPLTLPGFNAEELGKIEYPSAAYEKKAGVLFLAFDYTTSEGKEGIYLASLDVRTVLTAQDIDSTTGQKVLRITSKPVWSMPIQVSSTAGTEYAPATAIDGRGVLWIVWSARRGSKWEIYARTFAHGTLGEELQLTQNDEYDFRPTILSDRSGRVWVAWERGTKAKHINIVAKYFDGTRWSDELSLEDREGYAYRPVIVEAGDGSIWFAWDRMHDGNADVFLRQFRNGALQSVIRVTHHPAMDNKPALTWHDGKLWIAWSTNRREKDDWGIIRYTMVRAFDGERWLEPIGEPPEIDLKSKAETQSYEFPTLTFDRYGRMYLFTRHDHVFNAMYYEGQKWHSPWGLDTPTWGLRGLFVQPVWENDRILWLVRRDRKSVIVQKMERSDPKPRSIQLKEVRRVTYPDRLRSVEAKGDRGPTSKGNYRVYYGDLHVHTAYSDGSGSFDDVLHLYKYVYARDFIAITDHDALRAGDNHFSPSEWAYLKALNEIYNQPEEFVTLNGYEWTHSTWSGRQDSANRVGHKNVYFKGGEESPFFSHKGPVAYDPEKLFKLLHDADAIAFPHHPAWGGMTWEDHDPDIQTNYEIVSIHGANEFMGNLPIPHRGGMPGTFAQDGLARGAVIGFVGSSDSHGLYFHAHDGWREDPYKGGMTGVLLDGPLTRENVWQALKVRRNYATAGEKYFIEFFVNGFPMGSEVRTDTPPVITFEARSDKLLYAYILRDNKERFVSGPIDMRMARYTGMVDETVEPGRHHYYLRVVYKDGTVAWSSPIWVEYTPAARRSDTKE